MSNYEKYLKYKNKYLALKTQIGGVSGGGIESRLQDIPADKYHVILRNGNIESVTKYNIDVAHTSQLFIQQYGSSKKESYVFLSKNYPKFLFSISTDTDRRGNSDTSISYRMKPLNINEETIKNIHDDEK
jgi:hypothetical protein